jgi:hypothetical protein
VARQFKGARHGLDDELTADLLDYCNAMDTIPSKVIVRAIREYLAAQRSDPHVKRRLKDAEKKSVKGR